MVTFLSQRRETVSEAYPGDIIGIPNHGTLRLGDTLTEGEELQFTGLPFFAPEISQRRSGRSDARQAARSAEAVRRGGRDSGLRVAGRLADPWRGRQLQFEVVAHRLRARVPRRACSVASNYRLARWVTSDDAASSTVSSPPMRIAWRYDAVAGVLTVLFTHGAELS